MAAQDDYFLAGGGVPQACGLIVRGGEDGLAVRAEGGGNNRCLMAKNGDLSACRGFPQARGLIERRGDDDLAIGAERDRGDDAVVPAHDGNLLTGATSCSSIGKDIGG